MFYGVAILAAKSLDAGWRILWYATLGLSAGMLQWQGFFLAVSAMGLACASYPYSSPAAQKLKGNKSSLASGGYGFQTVGAGRFRGGGAARQIAGRTNPGRKYPQAQVVAFRILRACPEISLAQPISRLNPARPMFLDQGHQAVRGAQFLSQYRPPTATSPLESVKTQSP